MSEKRQEDLTVCGAYMLEGRVNDFSPSQAKISYGSNLSDKGWFDYSARSAAWM
jgi:hypothetical protein